jgi:hypothetical protein
MLLAASTKILGLFTPEQIEKLGLSVPIQVIGAGELVSALLLLFPRTASLGVLLTSGFWGGAICLHMSKGGTVCAPVRLPSPDLGGGVPARPGDVRQFCRLLAGRAPDRERHEGPRGLTGLGACDR